MTIAVLSCYVQKNHIGREDRNTAKVAGLKFHNAFALSFITDLALITGFVIGILGMTGVIHMPAAAYYTLLGVGGFTLITDFATAAHNVRLNHTLQKHSY